MMITLPEKNPTLKYSFLNEIHKTYSVPNNLKSMKEEILSLFVHKLPSPFLIQYEDVDGDKISISTEQEYQKFLQQDLFSLSSLKFSIVALQGENSSHQKGYLSQRSNSNGSFEVVEEEGLNKVGVIELNSSIDNQEEMEGKIVVSLQIPETNHNVPRPVESFDSLNSERTMSPSKSKISKSGDLIEDLSLSFEEEGSCVSHKVLEKGFQTEVEERLNVSNSSLEGNQKKTRENFGDRMDIRRKTALDILQTDESDSNNLTDYLNRVIQKKSQFGRRNNTPKISKLPHCSIQNLTEDDKTSKEGSQERWVSFTSDQEGVTNENKLNFSQSLEHKEAQRHEDPFRSFRNRLQRRICASRQCSDSSSDSSNKESLNLSIRSRRSGPKSIRRPSIELTPRTPKEIEKSLSLLKDEEVEERKGRYRELRQGSELAETFQGKFDESLRSDNSEIKGSKMMSEPSYPQYYFQNNIQNFIEQNPSKNNINKKAELDLMNGRQFQTGFIEDICHYIENDLRDVELKQETERDNMENMNVSLLSASEAKKMASAIGSIQMIREIKNFRSIEKERARFDFDLKMPSTPIKSPGARELEDKNKQLQESLWFSPQKHSWENPTPSSPSENLANEGTFCMRCWENPIKGPVYVCLVCDCIEYCERCAPTINHCHSLVKMKKKKAPISRESKENEQSNTQAVEKIANDEEYQQKKIEKKPHEGSFCMRCWENPIRGPMYVCLTCQFTEYCEMCYPKIKHCHALTRINEPQTLEDPFDTQFLAQLEQKPQENMQPYNDNENDKNNNNANFPCLDTLEKSFDKSLDLLWNYHPERSDKFAFSCKELSSTPLSIKSNQKEWCLIYKTVCLKNIGKAEWKRCHLEPVGDVMGTMTEVSYVAPDNSVLLTLEIHGFFTPGKYTSRWRVVHQGEMDVISEMGYLDLDFEILKNIDQPLLGNMQEL